MGHRGDVDLERGDHTPLFSVVLITFLILSGRTPSDLAVALYAWYLLNFFAIVVGFSLAASVLFMQYRDLNQVWEVVTQAGFFVAPIIYPIDVLPERLHFYLYLWPPTPVILFARSVLVDGKVPSVQAHGLLTLEALVVLALGAWIYRQRARHGPPSISDERRSSKSAAFRNRSRFHRCGGTQFVSTRSTCSGGVPRNVCTCSET